MSDYDVVTEDFDLYYEEEPKVRRWWGLLAVILLLSLLLCVSVTVVEQFTTGGKQRARFIARNVECLQCHTDKLADFSRATVHSPFGHKECDTCHTPHGKKITVTVTRGVIDTWKKQSAGVKWLPLKIWFQFSETSVEKVGSTAVSADEGASVSRQVRGTESQLTMEVSELCWMCHGDLSLKMSDPYVHQPFAALRCINCHNPHASNEPRLLVQAPDALCGTCHQMSAELSRKQAHSPVKDGWCTNCHDPHGSKFEGMLVASQRELCFRCHPTVAQKGDMAVQHVPFLNDQCTGCHEPHGSDTLPLLLTAQPGLCYSCHPLIADDFAKASHHPVGLDLTCGGCHDAHAAQYAGLLNANNSEFCYGCHAEFKTAFEPTQHNQMGCVGCHTPHGSSYEPILLGANPELCLGCHAPAGYDSNAGNNHPVTQAYFDINADRQLNCTTSCHNPHGTRYESNLRYFEAGADGNCLMCHAVTRGERVGIDF